MVVHGWWSSTAGLAQSAERGTFNPEVKGSTPLFGENVKVEGRLKFDWQVLIIAFKHRKSSNV